jgi:riboflavin biosynthesis pyrimidine reductase
MSANFAERREPSISTRTLRDERDVSEALASLLGEDPRAQRGVIHVAACYRDRDGLLHVLKVGSAAPQSASDFFLLQATRARAQAIVTTAEVLRAEPLLRHDLRGSHASALHAYRRACLGHNDPVEVVVLTRSGQLPLDHPAFHERARLRVLAAPDAVQSFASHVAPSLRIEAWSANSVRDVIGKLRAEGLTTISIEAGPRTAQALYENGAPGAPLVDEVCMSIYEGGEVGEAARGGALPADASLFAGLSRTSGDALVEEPSGRFRFMRWLRRTS